MLKTYPCHQGKAKHNVEESFVRYGENYKDRRECEEYHNQSMKIITLRSDPMQERDRDR